MSNKNFWIYAPGENANRWEEFHDLGIMGLGWDSLGDLNNYETKEQLVESLREKYPSSGYPKNDLRSNLDFKNAISKGDIIFVKKGTNQFLGWGIVESDYYYDSTRENYQKCRKVNWRCKGTWQVPYKIVQKTLTNVTNYGDYAERIMKLMSPDFTFDNSKDSNSGVVDITPSVESYLDDIIESDNKIFLYSITDSSLGWKKLNVYKDSNDHQLIYTLEDCEEYTYAILDPSNRLLKIGKTSRDPESRLGDLRTANPSINLIHVFPSSLYSERELHKKFDDLNQEREWFFFAKGLRKFITDNQLTHNKILESYRKRLELDKSEREILNHLTK